MVVTRIWAINGRFLTQPLTGVQRYAQEIVCALDALRVDDPSLAADMEIELLVPPGAQRTLPLETIAVRTVGRSGGHVWEQTVLPAEVRGGLVSLCNTGPALLGKHIACIHDVNPRAYPASYSLPFRLVYRSLLPVIGRRCRCVATVSHYSAGELVRYGIAPAGKLAVLPDGHEHALRWEPSHSSATAAVAGPGTIVVIGSTIPHKNVRLILSMADRLSAAGLRIAVVGAADPRVFSAQMPQQTADNVSWLGRCPDEALAALFRDCLCLAFPSYVEGFGLPPLEAMASGCVVVASDRTSLPEVCGSAALYASPDDPDAWFDCFTLLHRQPALRRDLEDRGRRQSSLFRWRDSALGYLDQMAEADGLEPPVRGDRNAPELMPLH